ncbi:MAG: radical SAM/SPASM domain-containing protein [Pseudomonadota bacterium]
MEIETHAKCNRLCSFCPNVDRNRIFNDTTTNAAVLAQIFQELGEIDYRGQLKVARYSEPLANIPYLYEQLKLARELIPHGELAIVTNTDYLNTAVLDSLSELGLDVVYMSIYLPVRAKGWSLKNARTYTDRVEEKLGLRALTNYEASRSVRRTYQHGRLRVQSACLDFSYESTDRGGLLNDFMSERRLAPCWEPFSTFVVDYTGDVVPCCNVLSDKNEHREFVVESLASSQSSIFDIYADKLLGWRRSMMTFDEKDSPCTTCRHKDAEPQDLPVLKKQFAARRRALGDWPA